jgi:hypothetical protein
LNIRVQREGHIVALQLEQRITDQVQDIPLGSGKEIIYAEDFMPFCQQTVTQM